MNFPYDQIENELNNFKWNIKHKVVFESVDMWFVKEIWELNKLTSTIFLNFLIDPQTTKQNYSLWAISITNKYPKSRKEAEQGELILLNKNLIANLKTRLKTGYNK